MPLQNSPTQNALSEPESYRRNLDREDAHGSASDRSADRAWLREQLLAGKNSPLCDPITPTHFDELRARVRRTFANKNQ
jgi:hypothetical protein